MRSFALTLALTLAACHKSGEDCSEGFGLAADGNCYPLATDAQTIGDADADSDADADADSDADTDSDADADTGDTGPFEPPIWASAWEAPLVDGGYDLDGRSTGYVVYRDIAFTNGSSAALLEPDHAAILGAAGFTEPTYWDCQATTESDSNTAPLVNEWYCGVTNEGRTTKFQIIHDTSYASWFQLRDFTTWDD